MFSTYFDRLQSHNPFEIFLLKVIRTLPMSIVPFFLSPLLSLIFYITENPFFLAIYFFPVTIHFPYFLLYLENFIY